LTLWMKNRNSRTMHAGRDNSASRAGSLYSKNQFSTNTRRMMFLFSIAAFATSMPMTSRSQGLPDAPDPAKNQANSAPVQRDLTYVRPTQRTMIKNYIFSAYGPYPLAISAVGAGINQFNNSPPEWQQGIEGYAKRYGSNYGILAVGMTTRYALSEAMKEDAMYYRCECRGIFPRLSHALISTLTARRGEDGHRVFSVPALVAPYAGSSAAIYGWYPSRYGAKDAFRTGNYSLLAYAGGNVTLEFFYSGPHSLLSRMHLNNAHGSPEPGPNH
jgi:hypothetical protein